MNNPLSRRTLCLGSLGSLAAVLSGCGFQPVYMPTASGKTGVAQRELASIYVEIIPERPGQVLRQALQERFGDDSGTPSAYNLSVTFNVSGQGIAIESDSIATRLRLIGTATWKLIGHDPKRTATSSSRSILPPTLKSRQRTRVSRRTWRPRSRPGSLSGSASRRRSRPADTVEAATGSYPGLSTRSRGLPGCAAIRRRCRHDP
jgi:hypothetical protein